MSHRMPCDACKRLSEVVSVERRCSRVVQLRTHVLTAAEHAAEAWEAVVTERVLRACWPAAVALDALRWVVATETSHATLVSTSVRL